MTKNIEIIIGTYEEFLLGYKLGYKNGERALLQSFADKSHTGSIKCLAVHGKFIATGGTDDRIFIYDMKARKQSQILLNHEGTVNSIAFTPDDTHILSAGDDGRVVAVRLNTWQVGANWKKAHNGSAVTHICCHPSGKLTLTLGTDLVLRTWNLVKGRVAYKTNLKNKVSLGGSPDCLTWSPTGDYFSMSGQRIIEIWCIKKADVLKSEKTTSKPICVCWASDYLLLAGLEDGTILFFSMENDKKTITVKAHTSRVKAISVFEDILVSASSSGDVKMWTVDVPNRTLLEIAATNVGCRPTCIGILDSDQFGSDNVEITEASNKEDIVKSIPIVVVPKEYGVVSIEYEDDEKQEESKSSDTEQDVQDVKKKRMKRQDSKKSPKKQIMSTSTVGKKQKKRTADSRNSEESASVRLKKQK